MKISEKDVSIIHEAVYNAVKEAMDSLGPDWVLLSFCNGAERFEFDE